MMDATKFRNECVWALSALLARIDDAELTRVAKQMDSADLDRLNSVVAVMLAVVEARDAAQ